MRLLIAATALACCSPAAAQQLPDGQGPAEYQAWIDSGPAVRGAVLSFEAWQRAAGVEGILPTWEVLRTASMWRECAGPPFEVPPHHFWPDMVKTLRFVRDHVTPAVGPVEAVSGYRNSELNTCARGSATSPHKDFFALDLVPLAPIERGELFRRLCAVHARHGPEFETGLGFYAFQRFHVDSRGFRRWGAAGPQGKESPCALIERGEDPLAEPPPEPVPEPQAAPENPAVRPG